MKVFGALLVICGCFGNVFLYLDHLKRHISRLEEWQCAMEIMEGEIRYGRASWPECFLRVSQMMNTTLAECFGRVAAQMKQELPRDPKALLEEELKCQTGGSIQEEKNGELLSFLSAHGYQEEQMQRIALERCRKRVEEKLVEKKKRYRSQCEVALSLGAVAASFIVLLLL